MIRCRHYRFGETGEQLRMASLDRAYYQEGDTVSIKADDPEDGMEFAGWKCEHRRCDDCRSVECRDEHFGSVGRQGESYRRQVQKRRRRNRLPIRLQSIMEMEAESYEEGSWVTVTAADRSQEGYEFAGWSVDSGDVSLADASAEKETAFTMPNVDVTLTATYTEAGA